MNSDKIPDVIVIDDVMPIPMKEPLLYTYPKKYTEERRKVVLKTSGRNGETLIITQKTKITNKKTKGLINIVEKSEKMKKINIKGTERRSTNIDKNHHRPIPKCLRFRCECQPNNKQIRQHKYSYKSNKKYNKCSNENNSKNNRTTKSNLLKHDKNNTRCLDEKKLNFFPMSPLSTISSVTINAYNKSYENISPGSFMTYSDDDDRDLDDLIKKTRCRDKMRNELKETATRNTYIKKENDCISISSDDTSLLSFHSLHSTSTLILPLNDCNNTEILESF